ncbi:hypothetical protein ACHAXR_009853 [Thalassiosira sp. AJA248-18]
MTAFILMWFGSARCDLVKFTDISGTSEPITREFGIPANQWFSSFDNQYPISVRKRWSYQYWALVASSGGAYVVKTCQTYPDSTEFDASWKAAKAFDVLTFMFSIIILVVWCIGACYAQYSPGGGRVFPLYILTGIFQGLVLIILDSKVCKDNYLVEWGAAEFPDTCSLATGGKCIISSMVFWFAAALSSFLEMKALEKESMEIQPDSLTEPLAYN